MRSDGMRDFILLPLIGKGLGSDFSGVFCTVRFLYLHARVGHQQTAEDLFGSTSTLPVFMLCI